MLVDIKTRRMELGLTLEEIGRMVGVSKSTVKKWESGYIKNMRCDKICLLARALQVSPIDLLGSLPDREIFTHNTHTCEKISPEYLAHIKECSGTDNVENIIVTHSKTHLTFHRVSNDIKSKIFELLSE